jgi:cell division protein FtsX
MDGATIALIITTAVTALGMGGFGGYWLNRKKILSEIKRLDEKNKVDIEQATQLTHIKIEQAKSDIEQASKLNQARIEQAKAESALLIEKARVELINDLQQERDTAKLSLEKAQNRIKDLEDQVSLWKSRASMLEMILEDNGIPIPA